MHLLEEAFPWAGRALHFPSADEDTESFLSVLIKIRTFDSGGPSTTSTDADAVPSSLKK